MSLPILGASPRPTQQDLLRYFNRTGLHWAEQLSDAVQLDVGVAMANPRLSRVHDANHLRDGVLPAGRSPGEALAEAEAHFKSVGTSCFFWVMNPSAPADQVDPLVKYLLERHYRRTATSIMRWSRRPDRAVAEHPGLKIIPARAAFGPMRLLAEESMAGADSVQRVEAELQRLDDPHWDCLLAFQDRRPVATVGVLAVGDLGRIENLFVSERVRGQGIGAIMMGRALEICARSLFKHVFLEVRPDNSIAIGLYQRFGFDCIGELAAYHAPGV